MPISKMNQIGLLDYLENLHAPNDGSLPYDLKSKEGNQAARKLVKNCLLVSMRLFEAFSRAIVLDDRVRDDITKSVIANSSELIKAYVVFESVRYRSTILIYHRIEFVAQEIQRILSKLRTRMQLSKVEFEWITQSIDLLSKLIAKIILVTK